MFADGPTRVLRFADVQNVGAEEAQQSILDLAARLKQARHFGFIPGPTLLSLIQNALKRVTCHQ